MNVLVITDNEYIYNNFIDILQKRDYTDIKFSFCCTPISGGESSPLEKRGIRPIQLKEHISEIISNYQLLLSLHCKQLFPSEIVRNVRCINIHPGFNPWNRGWYPQVFSILNKFPAGVTIHEIDEMLDHGPIIAQEKIEIFPWETSYDVYTKIQIKEVECLSRHLDDILSGSYSLTTPIFEGNINYKADFEKLCEIDLDKIQSIRETIDYFRALTFQGYKNAYFYDSSGEKIYLEIKLNRLQE